MLKRPTQARYDKSVQSNPPTIMAFNFTFTYYPLGTAETTYSIPTIRAQIERAKVALMHIPIPSTPRPPPLVACVKHMEKALSEYLVRPSIPPPSVLLVPPFEPETNRQAYHADNNQRFDPQTEILRVTFSTPKIMERLSKSKALVMPAGSPTMQDLDMAKREGDILYDHISKIQTQRNRIDKVQRMSMILSRQLDPPQLVAPPQP